MTLGHKPMLLTFQMALQWFGAIQTHTWLPLHISWSPPSQDLCMCHIISRLHV